MYTVILRAVKMSTFQNKENMDAYSHMIIIFSRIGLLLRVTEHVCYLPIDLTV